MRHLPDVLRTLGGMLKGLPGGTRPTLSQNFAFGAKTAITGAITGERSFDTQIADPVRRLRAICAAICAATGAVKELAKRACGVLPTDFPTITVPWILHGLATLYGRAGIADAIPPITKVVISNVPGPQLPLYAAGARMATCWPLSIPEHGVGVIITVMTYAGTLGFGFTTASSAVPDARKLTAALAAALEELVAKSRLPAGGKASSTARQSGRVLAPTSAPATSA